LKHLIFLIISTCFLFSCNAQIQLEHKFENQESIVNIEFDSPKKTTERFFVTYDSKESLVHIYDENYSHIVEMKTEQKNPYAMANITLISRGLFNHDNDIEFLMTDSKGLKLMKSSGEVLHNFGKNKHAYIIKVKSGLKLIVNELTVDPTTIPPSMTHNTEIYRLPGKY